LDGKSQEEAFVLVGASSLALSFVADGKAKLVLVLRHHWNHFGASVGC